MTGQLFSWRTAQIDLRFSGHFKEHKVQAKNRQQDDTKMLIVQQPIADRKLLVFCI